MIFSPVPLSTYPTPRARSGEPSDSIAASRTWTLAGGLSCVLMTSRSAAVRIVSSDQAYSNTAAFIAAQVATVIC